MNINKFTQNSLQAVQNCEKIAADNGNQELAQEHLLYALLTQDDSLILKLFEKMNIQGQLFINSIEQAIGKRPKVQGGQAYVGQDLNNVLIHAEPKFNIAEAALERLLKQEKTAQTARKMLTDFQSEINKVL